MDETYRMLGREHEADLEREAQKRSLAAIARAVSSRQARVSKELKLQRHVRFVPARLAAFLLIRAERHRRRRRDCTPPSMMHSGERNSRAPGGRFGDDLGRAGV